MFYYYSFEFLFIYLKNVLHYKYCYLFSPFFHVDKLTSWTKLTYTYF